MSPERLEIVDDAAVVAAWLSDQKRPPSKLRVNHAHNIGHPCDRHLVLKRTHGDKAREPSERLLAIFKRGHVLEQPVAVQQLQAAGWKTWDEQRTFDVIEKGEVIISCRIDCIAKSPTTGVIHVVDHKIVNPHDWEKIPRGWDGYDFLRNSVKPWLRAWPAQLTSYMYAHPGSAETGLLQLVNAETLLPKFVYVPFDVEYMQEILDRGHRLNGFATAVQKKGMDALPPPIEWDEAICGRCELLGICMPDQTGRTALELVEDASFIELVEQDRELSAQKRAIDAEYEKIHGRVKHMVGDRPELVAGRFWITTRQVDVKERTQKAYSYRNLTIKDMAPKEVGVTEESA